MLNNAHFYSAKARASYNARTGKYIPDWQKLAHTTHKNVKLSDTDIILSNYGAYSPAYVTTNEDWRFIVKSLNPQNKSVLTIAGSGDHPIAFATNGAKSVDTFDISYFAKVITDLKIAAIQTLDYKDYTNFVYSLRPAAQPSDIYAFDKISAKCPRTTQNAIQQMRGCFIFKQGIGVYHEHLPNETEYAATREDGVQQMNFIWSDVDSLPNYTTKKYDLIYLSNVFEHYRTENQIIKSLNIVRPGLADDGRVALYVSSNTPAKKVAQLVNAATRSELNKFDFVDSSNGILMILAPSQSR